MVLNASMAFFKKYNEVLRPSPTSFLFKINLRHMKFLLKGVLEVPNNYYRYIDNVAMVWVNEVCRTVLDRYTDPLEQEKLYEITKEIASSCFRVKTKIFCPDPKANMFFYG